MSEAALPNGILKTTTNGDTAVVPPPAPLSSTTVPGHASASARFGSKPTLITHSNLRFLIMDSPRPQNLHLYIKEMSRHSVSDCVRVCQPLYSEADLATAGITLHDLAYPDGTPPSDAVISQWLNLVKARRESPPASIAVHCVAGLGRAPVLVAIALIEFAGLDPVAAVDFIRKNRRGAINNKQLAFLEGYSPRMARGACGCVVF